MLWNNKHEDELNQEREHKSANKRIKEDQRIEKMTKGNSHRKKNITLVEALKLMNVKNKFSFFYDDEKNNSSEEQSDIKEKKKRKKKKEKELAKEHDESNESLSLSKLDADQNMNDTSSKTANTSIREMWNRRNRNKNNNKAAIESSPHFVEENPNKMKQKLSRFNSNVNENAYASIKTQHINANSNKMQGKSCDESTERLQKETMHKEETKNTEKNKKNNKRSNRTSRANIGISFASKNYNLLANVNEQDTGKGNVKEAEINRQKHPRDRRKTHEKSTASSRSESFLDTESCSDSITTTESSDSDSTEEEEQQQQKKQQQEEGKVEEEKKKKKYLENTNGSKDMDRIADNTNDKRPLNFLKENMGFYSLGSGKKKKKKNALRKDRNAARNKFKEFSFLSYRKEIANLYEKENELLKMSNCEKKDKKLVSANSLNGTTNKMISSFGLKNNANTDDDGIYFRLKCSRSVMDKLRRRPLKSSFSEFKNAINERKRKKKKKRKKKRTWAKYEENNYKEDVEECGSIHVKQSRCRNMEKLENELQGGEKKKLVMSIFKNFINYSKLKNIHDYYIENTCDNKTLAKLTQCVVHHAKQNVDFRTLQIYLVCNVDINQIEATIYSVKKKKALFNYIFTPNKIDYILYQFEKNFKQRIKRRPFVKRAEEVFITKRDYLKCVETVTQFLMVHHKTTYAAFEKHKAINKIAAQMLSQMSSHTEQLPARLTKRTKRLKDVDDVRKENKMKQHQKKKEDVDEESEYDEKEEDEEEEEEEEEVEEEEKEVEENSDVEMDDYEQRNDRRKGKEKGIMLEHSQQINKVRMDKDKNKTKQYIKEIVAENKTSMKQGTKERTYTRSINRKLSCSSSKGFQTEDHDQNPPHIKKKELNKKGDLSICEMEKMKKLVFSSEELMNLLFDQHKSIIQCMKIFISNTCNENRSLNHKKMEDNPILIERTEHLNVNSKPGCMLDGDNRFLIDEKCEKISTQLKNEEQKENLLKLYTVNEIRSFKKKINTLLKMLLQYTSLTFKTKKDSDNSNRDEFYFVNFDEVNLKVNKLLDQIKQEIQKIGKKNKGIKSSPQKKRYNDNNVNKNVGNSFTNQKTPVILEKKMLNVPNEKVNNQKEKTKVESTHPEEEGTSGKDVDERNDESVNRKVFTEKICNDHFMPFANEMNMELFQNVNKLYSHIDVSQNGCSYVLNKTESESSSECSEDIPASNQSDLSSSKNNVGSPVLNDRQKNLNSEKVGNKRTDQFSTNNMLKSELYNNTTCAEDLKKNENQLIKQNQKKEKEKDDTDDLKNKGSSMHIFSIKSSNRTNRDTRENNNKRNRRRNRLKEREKEQTKKDKEIIITKKTGNNCYESYSSCSEFDMLNSLQNENLQKVSQWRNRSFKKKRRNMQTSDANVTKELKERIVERGYEKGENLNEKKQKRKGKERKKRKDLEEKEQKVKKKAQKSKKKETETKKMEPSRTERLPSSNENKNECKVVNISKLIARKEVKPLSDITEVLANTDDVNIHNFNLFTDISTTNKSKSLHVPMTLKGDDINENLFDVDTSYIQKQCKTEEKKEEIVMETEKVIKEEAKIIQQDESNEVNYKEENVKKEKEINENMQNEIKDKRALLTFKGKRCDTSGMDLQLMQDENDYSFVEVDSEDRKENEEGVIRNIYEEYITQEEAIKGIMSKKYVRGIVSVKNCDYAYVMFDGKKLHIHSKRDINRALDGDVVVAEVYGRKKKIKKLGEGGYEYEYEDEDEANDTVMNNAVVGTNKADKPLKGKIVYIEEHGGTDTYYVCLFRDKLSRKGINMAVPFKKNIPLIRVSGENVFSYMEKNNISNIKGHLVHIKVFRWERNQMYPEGKIKEMLGANDILHNMQRAILLNRNLEYNLKEAIEDSYIKDMCKKNVYEKIFEEEKNKRLNLTNHTICTIDPETAKDLDDAVHISRIKKNKLLSCNYYIQVVHNLIEHNGEIEEAILKKNLALFVNDDTSFFDKLKQDNSVKEMEGIKKYNFKQEKEEQAEEEEVMKQIRKKKKIKRDAEKQKKREIEMEREKEIKVQIERERELEKQKYREMQHKYKEQEILKEFVDEERDTESAKGKKFRTNLKKIDSDSSELDFLKILSEQDELFSSTEDNMSDTKKNLHKRLLQKKQVTEIEKKEDRTIEKEEKEKMKASKHTNKKTSSTNEYSSEEWKSTLGVPSNQEQKKRKRGMQEMYHQVRMDDSSSFLHEKYENHRSVDDNNKENVGSGSSGSSGSSGEYSEIESSENERECSGEDSENMKQVITFQNMYLEKEKERERRNKKRDMHVGKGIGHYYNNEKEDLKEIEKSKKKEERRKKRQMKEIIAKLLSKNGNTDNYFVEEKEEDIGHTIMNHDLFCPKCNKYINIEDIKKVVENKKENKYQLYELGVHITDVSFFVKENSSLDIDARNRAMTIYLAHTCFPMLSRLLSENLCSLDPKCCRLCVSVFFYMDSSGKIDHNSFFFRETIINSKIRFTYEEVYIAVKTYMRLKNKMKKIKETGLRGFQQWKEKQLDRINRNKNLELVGIDAASFDAQKSFVGLKGEIVKETGGNEMANFTVDNRKYSQNSILSNEKEEIRNNGEHMIYRNFINKYFYNGAYQNETTKKLCSMLKEKLQTTTDISAAKELCVNEQIEPKKNVELKNKVTPFKKTSKSIMLPYYSQDDAANKKVYLTKKMLKNVKVQKRIKELLYIFKNLKHTKHPFTTEEIFTIVKKLHDMYKVTQNARELRRKNGSLLFSNTKIDFILSQDKDTIGIVKKRLTFSNYMIEELMLSANKLVAIRQYFSKYREISIFRSHNPTDALDVSDIIDLLKTHDIHLSNCNLRQVLKYLDDNKHTFTSKKKNIFDVVSSFVKKKMKRAEYHTFKFIIHNRMSTYHYALSFLLYTHFTSPIRRYPDILVQRIIKNIIADEYKLMNNLCSAEELLKNSQSTDVDILEKICTSCNHCKTQSKKVQMDCEIAFFCLYLQKLEYPGYCKGIIMDIQRERSAIFFKSFSFESTLYHENFQKTVQKVGKTYLKYVRNYVIIPNISRNTITVILYDDKKSKILQKKIYSRFSYIPLYLIPLNSMPPSYLLTVAFKNV